MKQLSGQRQGRWGAYLTFIGLSQVSPVWAHHSTITFDTTKQVEFSGVVSSWTVSNPHAYLTVLSKDDQGRTATHRCETFSVAALQGMGIDAHSFSAGDTVTVKGAPSRVSNEQCLLEGVQRAGGVLVSFQPSSGSAASPPVIPNTSMFGTWAPVGQVQLAGPPGSTPATAGKFRFRAMTASALDHETPAGHAADAQYRPLHDDPTYHCSPVGPLRVWHEPDTVLSVAKQGDDIVFDYEFMDAKRVVHMKNADAASAAPSELGYSVGHFEGETLVVETSKFLPGVIMQYALNEKGDLHGVLHSDQYQITERVHFDGATHQLEVQFSQSDPKFYTPGALGADTIRFTTSPRPTFSPYRCQASAPPA